jgi:hypothetical protein
VLDEVDTIDFDDVEGVVVGVVEDEDEEDVEEPPQAPVIEGTASTPLPMATRFVPQSAALATRRFWLSWS